MKNKTLLFFMLIISVVTACKKDYFMAAPADLNTSVSFSQDISPIFVADCAMGGCHAPGGPKPDLSPAVAVDQLLGLAYVDTTQAPEKSILYVRMIDTSKPMPPAGKLSSEKLNKVLAWIKQGAQNN